MTPSSHLPSADKVLIRATDVEKSYRRGEHTIHALAGVSIDVMKGEFIAIMGTSGSGKSTLLNMFGGLDVPSAGQLFLFGQDARRLAPNELACIRNSSIGFVFQQFNLLARTSALRQVMLPLQYRETPLPREAALQRARDVLAAVQLQDRMDHFPSQLSGGQQQRVAIARAIVNSPKVILADEPTGALDSHTSREVMDLLIRLNSEGIAIVLVTHDPDVAAFAKRIVTFRDGRIVSDVRNDLVALEEAV